MYLVELDIGGGSAGWLEQQPAPEAGGVGVNRAITGENQVELGKICWLDGFLPEAEYRLVLLGEAHFGQADTLLLVYLQQQNINDNVC